MPTYLVLFIGRSLGSRFCLVNSLTQAYYLRGVLSYYVLTQVTRKLKRPCGCHSGIVQFSIVPTLAVATRCGQPRLPIIPRAVAVYVDQASGTRHLAKHFA